MTMTNPAVGTIDVWESWNSKEAWRKMISSHCQAGGGTILVRWHRHKMDIRRETREPGRFERLAGDEKGHDILTWLRGISW